jgi:DNA mismatch repair protein MutS2
VAFVPGDRVHLPRLGTGIVRDVRNGDRYVVEIKGRTMVVERAQLERADPDPPRRRKEAPRYESSVSSGDARTTTSIDLHGKTVDEAVEAIDTFINDALLASHAEVRIIHGRSGGRIRDAVHKRLRALPVKSFRLDPRNPGVTIATL